MASGKVERKRQARGQARIQSLLLAAESVFARSGYSKATTNEIAAEAQVSPATLYQFFVNKEEIANSLARITPSSWLNSSTNWITSQWSSCRRAIW